jgi:hypothetical protein
MDKPVIIRSSEVSLSEEYGWTISCYEDSTKIETFEFDSQGGKKIIDAYEFPVGFDEYIFKEALRLREMGGITL